MKTVVLKLSVEDYVRCEKAAQKEGVSIEKWLSFLLTDKVGHTSF